MDVDEDGNGETENVCVYRVLAYLCLKIDNYRTTYYYDCSPWCTRVHPLAIQLPIHNYNE